MCRHRESLWDGCEIPSGGERHCLGQPSDGLGFFLEEKEKADGRMCCVDSSCCGFGQLCQIHATPSGILGTAVGLLRV